MKNGENWSALADENEIKKLNQQTSSNRIVLGDEDLVSCEKCFKESSCQTNLILNDVQSWSEQKDSGSRSNFNFFIKKVTSKLFVAVSETGSSFIFIDVDTGKMVPWSVPQRLTFDFNLRHFITAVFQISTSEITIRDTNGESKNVLSKIPFYIDDMDFQDGLIYAIASRRSKKFHLSSALTRWTSHGISFKDWFMLEINPKTGERKEILLKENVSNSSGRFHDKWRFRE
jgi:hypothetical protein